jgi:beta-galactosidase
MYESDHNKYPERVMMGTESYPLEAFENWQQVKEHPYVIGDFVWTGMDYIGEAGIGHIVKDSINDTPLMGWPWFNANCGDLDLLGNQKPQSYYRDVLWNKRAITMAVHAPMNDRTEHISKWGWPDEQQRWSWPGHEGELMDVNVYTKSEAVRLYLNGKVIATKTLHDTAQLTIAFKVAYQPGVLKAIAVDRGLDGDSILLTTNAGVNKIQLDADRNTIQASRNDLAYIAVSLRDENGNVVMDDDRIVTFNISGVGDLAAAGNAHPYEVQSFQQPSCKTYQGKCLAILRPKGTKGSMRLQATSGLLKTSITIQCVQK